MHKNEWKETPMKMVTCKSQWNPKQNKHESQGGEKMNKGRNEVWESKLLLTLKREKIGMDLRESTGVVSQVREVNDVVK